MRITFIALCFLLVAGCNQPEQARPLVFESTGDVKHIMKWVLDPAADHLWDSAGTIITEAGEEELAPTTNEGWLAVQHSAVVVAESANLLLMPDRTRDDDAWREISLGLVSAGMRAKAAAEAKNPDELFEAGAQLYRVCKSCHAIYVQGDQPI
jgi:hypothetical protein